MGSSMARPPDRLGSSSTERLPIERAVLETAKTFAALSFDGRKRAARK